MLDFYANRNVLFSKHSDLAIISKMNINQFVRTYHVNSRGRLIKYDFPAKNIVRFKPSLKPSVSDFEKMTEYCKYSLIRYKVWHNEPFDAWGEAGDSNKAIIHQ